MSALPKRLAGLTDKLAGKAPANRAEERPTHLRPVPSNGEPAPAPSTVSEPGREVQPAPPSLIERAREEFTPPDVWTTDRPSLSKIAAYGRHNQQVPDGGLARAATTAWSWFAMYHAARGYARQWLTERLARTAVFVALVVVASLIPETRAVLTLLLWPAHTAIELITDF